MSVLQHNLRVYSIILSLPFLVKHTVVRGYKRLSLVAVKRNLSDEFKDCCPLRETCCNARP